MPGISSCLGMSLVAESGNLVGVVWHIFSEQISNSGFGKFGIPQW